MTDSTVTATHCMKCLDFRDYEFEIIFSTYSIFNIVAFPKMLRMNVDHYRMNVTLNRCTGVHEINR